jgi:pilus assembly protein CpaC
MTPKRTALALSVLVGWTVQSAAMAASEPVAASGPLASASASVPQRSQAQARPVPAAAPVAAAPVSMPGSASMVPPASVDAGQPAEVGPSMSLTIGKSTLVRLDSPIERISVGNPSVADVTLISNRELYLLGKTFGSTNVIMWRRNGATTIIDVDVGMDARALEARLRELLPEEKDIRVSTAANAVVLSGVVSSALKAEFAVSIAEAFARLSGLGITLPVVAGGLAALPGQPITVGQAQAPRTTGGDQQNQLRVVNMLQIGTPQQVMLEVKVAEISKTLLDKLGVGMDLARVSGDWRYGIISNFLSDSSGVLGLLSRTGNAIKVDGEKQDGLVRVLAEPNIVSISGQEASFLAGGRIFIPVSRTNGLTGVPAITLEEKEFGVGLKFTPTVLDGDRINLRVSPEVSELSQSGSPFATVNGTTSILPSFTTRRAQTTVQLRDGQSFAIAGLIKNNVTETIRRFPVLGDVPILGALFRSSEFQTDRTELMFIVTARLVKPLPAGTYSAPTDNWTPPSRSEFFVGGQLEGSGHPDVPASPPAPVASPAVAAPGPASPDPGSRPAAVPAASGGFQLR